jgi:hypothetical protein
VQPGGLAAIATTGAYTDLLGKPTIPTTLAGLDTTVTGAQLNADHTKLSGVATNATANSSDATLLARANHTGTQTAGTITGLAAVATSGAYTDLTGTPTLGTAAATNSTAYATAAQGATADTAVQPAALNLKADLASPTFTGTPTLPTPVINGTPTGTGVATASTASTLALRDSNANLTADVFIPGTTSTVTAAGTTTLTISDTQVQIFTGSTTQTVLLPTTGVTVGMAYTISNQSSGNVTAQSSAAGALITVNAGRMATFVARINAPTAAADWSILPTQATASTANTLARFE